MLKAMPRYQSKSFHSYLDSLPNLPTPYLSSTPDYPITIQYCYQTLPHNPVIQSFSLLITMKVFSLILLSLLPFIALSTNTCSMKSTYIPSSNMASFVSRYIDAVTPDNSLVQLITNPSGQNALAYSKTLMPIIIPIFAFAVIATIFMIVACVQMCCVGCCNSQKCRCTSYTYGSIKWLIGFIILFLLLLIGGGIAGMIFNHDTLAATSNTKCIASQVFETIINGNNSTNWDGLANLTNLAINVSMGFSNNIGTLVDYITNATTQSLYTSLTTGTLYTNVETNSQCAAGTVIPTAVTCPSGQANCQANLMVNFCNNTGNYLGASNITKQFSSTTYVYANRLTNMTAELIDMNTYKANVTQGLNTLVNQTAQLSSSSQNYQATFQNVAGTINYGLYITEIAIYVAYGFLILCSFCSILILTMIFCCRCFKMTGCVQFSWIFYWLMTTIILIISGFQYLASVAIVNSCQSYNYFINNSSNFNSLPRNNFIDGYSACLFQAGATSLMDGIFNNSENSQFNNMVTQMNIFNNLGNFSTVATGVYNQIANLTAYPEYATVQSPNNPTQPLAALKELNQYANYSATNSNQGCNVLKDVFVYSTDECGVYPIETGTNNYGNNSCILLSTSNTATFSDRGNLLSNCANPGQYQNSANNLATYGQDFRNIAIADLLPSPLFTAYPQAYYNYYVGLNKYLSPPFMAQINSFVQPYDEFYNGLSCSYLNSSITQIQTQVCNNFNPYLYFLSVINISIGSICFAIMLLFYFLHPRLEFYAQMEGNLEDIYNEREGNSIAMTPMTDYSNRVQMGDYLTKQ